MPPLTVELTAQLAHDVDSNDVIQRLRTKIESIPNVVKMPAPEIEILTFTQYGAVLAVYPYCANDHYWQVYFDVNKAIASIGTDGGYRTPEQRMVVRNITG